MNCKHFDFTKLLVIGSSIVTVAGGMLLPGEATYALPLNIVNPGFENPVVSNGSFNIATPTSQTIPGWTVISFGSGGNSGVYNPTNSDYQGASDPNSPFELAYQQNVLYTNGFAVEQSLTTTLRPNVRYKLSVDVGKRANVQFPPNGAFVNLLAGSTMLAASTLTSAPPEGKFVTLTFIYTSPSSSSLSGQNLKVRIGSSSPSIGQVTFDNVRLEQIPLNF